MQIDLNILIQNTLPAMLRKSRLVNLLRVLLQAVVSPFNWFVEQLPDYEYSGKSNASVISLQHQIAREFDIDAVITPLSGKPFDFLVQYSGIVDENRLRAYINDNKLAGKSFVFETGVISWENTYTNHICEKVSVENTIALEISNQKIWAKSLYPVDFEIHVDISVATSEGSVVFNAIIPLFQNKSEEYTFIGTYQESYILLLKDAVGNSLATGDIRKWINNEHQRSITLQVSCFLNSNIVEGYPHIYQGKLAFVWQGVNYPVLSSAQLQQLSLTDYNNRLNAFQTMIEGIEDGLDLSVDSTNTARIEDAIACPIE